MNEGDVMMVGPSGVGETVETKMKEVLKNLNFSFTMPSEEDEKLGSIRRPWQIMDHLITWDRQTNFHLLVSDVRPDAFPHERMISGDLAEMKELAMRFAHDYNVTIQMFYGNEVPDVPVNRQNAALCYALLTASRELVEKIQHMFQQSDWYVQIRYNYLPRRGHREYALDEGTRCFAMTLDGLSLFRDFLKGWYRQAITDKEQAARRNPAQKQEYLMLKLTAGMQTNRLVPDDALVQLAKRVEDGWQTLMSDSGRPITECNRKVGESVYSMVQFERMMAERRGENWHDWL